MVSAPGMSVDDWWLRAFAKDKDKEAAISSGSMSSACACMPEIPKTIAHQFNDNFINIIHKTQQKLDNFIVWTRPTKMATSRYEKSKKH